MKDDKIIRYLLSGRTKKTKATEETQEDRRKYDARLLAFLGSDQVRRSFHGSDISFSVE